MYVLHSRVGYLPSILTTRPVALVLVELKHAVWRQWAEHVVLDESRLDLYSLRPMSIYRTTMSVHGARKNSTEESSNAYGSLLASPHVDSSGMILPSSSRAYTSPICMACTNENDTWLLSFMAQCAEGFSIIIIKKIASDFIFYFSPTACCKEYEQNTNLPINIITHDYKSAILYLIL